MIPRHIWGARLSEALGINGLTAATLVFPEEGIITAHVSFQMNDQQIEDVMKLLEDVKASERTQ